MSFNKREKLSKEERKYLKFSAYDALIEWNETSLPVSDDYLQKTKHDIFVLSMQFVSVRLGHEENYFSDLGENYKDCFCMYVSATKHFLILYNEHLQPNERRWNISKGLSLIKLGVLELHPDTFISVHYDELKSDEFSYFYTCPDVILNECDILSASKILKYCDIPFVQANKKETFLKKLIPSKSLQFIEELLKKNFSSFISLFDNYN